MLRLPRSGLLARNSQNPAVRVHLGFVHIGLPACSRILQTDTILTYNSPNDKKSDSGNSVGGHLQFRCCFLSSRLCDLPKLGITPEETTENTRCDREITWHLSGRVLERNISKSPPFALFVEYPKSATITNLVLDLVLVGFPKDPSDKSPPPPPWPIVAECK